MCEGRAVLKQRPFTAVGRPEPPVGGLASEPCAGLVGVLGNPECEVGVLSGRFGTQPTGEPKEVFSISEEGNDRSIVLPAATQPPNLARLLQANGRPPQPAGVCNCRAGRQGERGRATGTTRHAE
eukprot:7454362-Alexandrium_andersonii.AAC.1